MNRLRLIADDLTGALDTAAEFVPLLGPVRTLWGAPVATADALAFDAATREGTAVAAEAAVFAAATRLDLAGAAIAYLKLDSLLRGHAGAEIAACLAAGRFSHVIIAPAFPFQNRRTRAGRQWAPLDGAWRATGEDIAATLRQRGHAVTLASPGDALPAGISLWDAEVEADLATLVATARAVPAARILWCGSGGLAGALVAASTTAPALTAPLLGLFGTDHPVTHTQLDRAGAAALTVHDIVAGAEAVTRRLASAPAAFVRLALPTLERAEAARRIAADLGGIADAVAAPATLVCGGGETLRALLTHLGADGLDVIGRLEPGVPVARLVGGRWAGVTVVSKSGAFGDPDFLVRLAASVAAPVIAEDTPT
jgi:uncharacterized protein YgbK (DUF1537 family)